MKELPLVSFVTPVYNGAEYLDELIQSVLQRDHPNIEYLIIDYGSQDDSATVYVLEGILTCAGGTLRTRGNMPR